MQRKTEGQKNNNDGRPNPQSLQPARPPSLPPSLYSFIPSPSLCLSRCFRCVSKQPLGNKTRASLPLRWSAWSLLLIIHTRGRFGLRLALRDVRNLTADAFDRVSVDHRRRERAEENRTQTENSCQQLAHRSAEASINGDNDRNRRTDRVETRVPTFTRSNNEVQALPKHKAR